MKMRKVIVEVRIPLVVEVGEDWDKNLIEFWRQGSSSCASNWLAEAAEVSANALGQEGGCQCQVIRHRYVREATEEEARTGLCVDESITEELDNGC